MSADHPERSALIDEACEKRKPRFGSVLKLTNSQVKIGDMYAYLPAFTAFNSVLTCVEASPLS